MLSRTTEKLLRKLTTRKYRWQLKMFIAEGRKVVQELLDEGLHLEHLIIKEGSSFVHNSGMVIPVKEFEKLSQLDTADEVIAIFRFPEVKRELGNRVVILDKINDPGNLGTIIRTCDWFGITQIFCTTGTVDAYNSKTVQSTMGSAGRVNVSYASEVEILEELKAQDFSFWCADMEGENLNEAEVPQKMALVMGSESHGPSDFWRKNSQRVTIPRKGKSKTESLNVAIATAIILGNISLGR
ncbi:rRNA methylase [Owenweeksia hongkongensis DSM 17368]|uniref:rRNA methylase n=1 Tax=Owenweeksia hongkongensis (strain DSM 17368 / CIP 108786 / JCM 12287 / NRRL B-23963 / UST20020801) TaxID=926562 RepID=G8R8S3_OWEHD|nr:RNA methyltransferase [Owenweeksia hongkongensis]AEV32503.1 rRNA methylase [Owenweeksia hongkongensis DSM 17368]